MRYACPIALPVGLGEWLGAELEARGVESASLYARAVISILLQSDKELEFEVEVTDPVDSWSRRAAMELELKLERQRERETKRGRPRQKPVALRHKSHAHKVAQATPPKKEGWSSQGTRRRPHSWNGDGDELKKSAAIECLLSATDERWPVEKLVDELYARVKLIQLEGPVGKKWAGLMGSSAPVYTQGKQDSQDGTTVDSDSFTSVSTPDGELENYLSAFPPLDVSTSSEEAEPAQLTTVWSLPLKTQSASSPIRIEDPPRVPFLRMTGTRLSPQATNQVVACPSALCDNSEAYFGDCSSRESSLERNLPEDLTQGFHDSSGKGRLYQRGSVKEEWKDWAAPAAAATPEDTQNIWAPSDKDWNLLGQHAFCSDIALDKLSDEAVYAVQQSLAVLNHNPRMSSFAEVVPHLKYLGSSKLFQWMGAVKRKVLEHSALRPPDPSDEDNLLISPQTHFCPIQDEAAEPDIDVKDGATFTVDARPDPVHFLRSPSGALYLPEPEENAENGWGGWTKYMVYQPATPPSGEEAPGVAAADPERAGSPFPLKFRVLQTEKYCQTEVLAEEAEATEDLIVPFQPCSVLLNTDDVWKFDAEILKEVTNQQLAKEEEDEPEEEEEGQEEEEEGLLKEVFNFGAEAEPQQQLLKQEEAEADLDELWNPLDGDGYDICEWVSQDVYKGEEFAGEEEADWSEKQWAELCAESWPPPYIPVEYLDDEFFDEIYGSLEAKSATENKTSSEKKSSRRRRRTSQKGQQVQQQHRRRPCSFFVEGECLRPDCKFSHDLGSIPCRFWLESSCFKGDACPFMHGKPAKSRGRRRSYSQSDADAAAAENSASGNSAIQRIPRHTNPKKPNFELDLENDFPSLSQSIELKVSKSRPIPISSNVAFAAADSTGSSVEGGGSVKRRRRKTAAQRPSAAPPTSDSSPCVKRTIKSAAAAARNAKKNAAARQRSVSEQADSRSKDG